MVVSMQDRMNRLLQYAAREISNNQEGIQTEWEQFALRLKQNTTLIDLGSGAHALLNQVSDLFWKHLPFFCEGSIDTALQRLQMDWEHQINEPPHVHKFILLLTMLEKHTHKVLDQKQSYDVQAKQAVQHFFSTVAQSLLTKADTNVLTIEDFVVQLFSKAENPFLWSAKISLHEKGYKIDRFFTNSKLAIDEAWKNIVLTLQGPSLDILSDAILRLLSAQLGDEELDVLPFSVQKEGYLFCIQKSEADQIKSFFTLSLQLLKQNEMSHDSLQMKNDWKDSLILFDEWIMLARNFQEAIEKIVSGFTNYLPFQRAALFYYTQTDGGEDIGIGVMGHRIATKEIRNIRENLNNIPQITKTLTRIQPMFVPKAEHILPEKFVKQFELESLVIAPIYSAFNHQILGAVFLDQGEGETFAISNAILPVLTKFGQHAGEILAKYSPDFNKMIHPSGKSNLKHREIEILKLMAEGKTIDEAAEQLFLSKYTVRDYISTIMKKLNAQNRTQAIAEAIRHGWI